MSVFRILFGFLLIVVMMQIAFTALHRIPASAWEDQAAAAHIPHSITDPSKKLPDVGTQGIEKPQEEG